MPIEFKKWQAIVHCRGDITALPFSPRTEGCEGVAWLLLQERRDDQPCPEAEGIHLVEQSGVFIAANDPASLDPIIDALAGLRTELALHRAARQQEQAAPVPRVAVYRAPDSPPYLSGVRFSSLETHQTSRGTVKVCQWPAKVPPMNVAGKVVVIDGSLYEVLAVEFGSGADPTGAPVGLLVREYRRKVHLPGKGGL